MPVQLPAAAWKLLKEIARHTLRRPVVGIAAAAKTRDGKYVLVRRGDTGEWALPGGTLEWGETLKGAIRRELLEEAGVEALELGDVSGVYSHPDRDFRFHAVTVVVHASVTDPLHRPMNPLEILEVGAFAVDDLPSTLSHDMTDMLKNAVDGRRVWE